MKYTFRTCTLLFIASVMTASSALASAQPAQAATRYSRCDDVRVFAHRGLYTYKNLKAAEDTVQSAVQAAKRGYGAEMDLRVTKDGSFVLMHDSTIYRTIKTKNRTIGVEDLTRNQVKKLRTRDFNQKVPFLSQVLKATQNYNKFRLRLEIKESGDWPTEKRLQLKKLLERYNYTSKVQIYSRGSYILGEFKKDIPDAPTIWNVKSAFNSDLNDPNSHINTVLDNDIKFVLSTPGWVDKDDARIMKQNGRRFSAINSADISRWKLVARDDSFRSIMTDGALKYTDWCKKQQ